MRTVKLLVLALVACLMGVPVETAAASTFGVGRQGEVEIRMRDGVVLRANVYYPTANGTAAAGKFPVILTMTPYGKDTGDSDPNRGLVGMGKASYLVEHGYIYAIVDVRGTGVSDGDWSFASPAEIKDGLELVDWASRLPQSNGKVGMMGQSYAAINQMLVAASVGPKSPLKAILPIVPALDIYRDALVLGGVPNPLLPAVYIGANVPSSLANVVKTYLLPSSSPPDIGKLVSLLVQHAGSASPLPVLDILLGGPDSTYSPYWRHIAVQEHLSGFSKNKVKGLVLTGWRDVFQRGAPQLYAALQRAAAGKSVYKPMRAKDPVSSRFQMIVGPWNHADIGLPGSKDRVYPERLALEWFDHWLKGKPSKLATKKKPLRVQDFTTGRWTSTKHFPFKGAKPKKLYFGAERTLAIKKPQQGGSDSILWSNAPLCTPSTTQSLLIGNDAVLSQQLGIPLNPCYLDETLTQQGPSATTYTTAPMSKPLTIAGPISARILATANTSDTQWVVRVSDVAPDGTATPLAKGGLLGSYRAVRKNRSWKDAQGNLVVPYHDYTSASARPVTPGQLTAYDVEIASILATIEPGHRLRITVGSNDSPVFVPTASQLPHLVGGVYEISRGAGAASYVQVQVARRRGLR